MSDEELGVSEYSFYGMRPPRAAMAEMPAGSVDLTLQRAVNRFLAEHAPRYGRGDVTEVVLDAEPVGMFSVRFKSRVCFTHVREEQV
jgi:hypothetical protein